MVKCSSRKIVYCMTRIILAIFIFLFLLSNFSFATFMKLNVAFAQEELAIKEATESSETLKKKAVDYQLPYPGLLPDSPLYFLKAARDRIVDFLISDPLKKADFYLLQADKRLNSGVYFFKIGKSKYNLAESAISKGENYFGKAIAKAREAKGQGMDIADISRRLLDASKKHQEVLMDLEKNADSKIKGSLKSLLKRVDGFEKEAASLTQK